MKHALMEVCWMGGGGVKEQIGGVSWWWLAAGGVEVWAYVSWCLGLHGLQESFQTSPLLGRIILCLLSH